MKKVSIIIPVYNTEKYVLQALASCVGQTYKNYEIIIVNDGSTDDSLRIIKEYLQAHKNFEAVVSSIKNSGLSAARNAGLRQATGEFVCFLDADDLLTPELIEKCVFEMEANTLDMLTFDSFTFSDDGYAEYENLLKYSIHIDTTPHRRILSGREFAWVEQMSKGVFVAAWQSFYRKGFLDENRIRFLNGAIYEDNAFHFACLYHARRVMYFPEILIKHRIRSGSIMQTSLDARKVDSVFEIAAYIMEVVRNDRRTVELNPDWLDYAYHIVSGLISLISIQLSKQNYHFIVEQADRISSQVARTVKSYLDLYCYVANDDAGIKKSRDLLFDFVRCFDFYSEGMRKVGITINAQFACNRLKALEVFHRPELKVGLYGCGNYARVLVEQLEKIKNQEKGFFENEYVFIESQAEHQEKQFLGHSVISIRDAESNGIDAIVVFSHLYSKCMQEYAKAFAPSIPVYLLDGSVSFSGSNRRMRYYFPGAEKIPLDATGWMDKYFAAYPLEPVKKRRIFLLCTPRHDNVGDYLITLAEKLFFAKYYPNDEVIEIDESRLESEGDAIFKQIRLVDLVVITGGGFIGIWDYRKNVESILMYCKRNKIVIFPHSAYFGEAGALEHLQEMNLLISKCTDVTFIARERFTYDFITKFLPAKAKKVLMPDIALTMEALEFNKKRHGVALFLRKDKESILSTGDRDMLAKNLKRRMLDVCWGSMHSGQTIMDSESESAVYEKLSEIAGYELVVTDMLHGMISCALTGTPCLALNNVTRKVEGVYNWIKSLDYIDFVADINELMEKLSDEKVFQIRDGRYELNFEDHMEHLREVVD